MIRDKARLMLQTAVVAGAMCFAPMVTHAQATDTTVRVADTDHDRGFDWGWLGLLGLLGLIPRKRKDTVVETRTTGGTGTGGRY